MNETEKRILEKLKKTGFPTEIKATKILSKGLSRQDRVFILTNSSWNYTNQLSFFDEKNTVIGSLDIHAIRAIDNISDDDKIDKICELYIECKKSSKIKWIFYCEETLPSDREVILRRTWDQRKLLEKEYHPFYYIPKIYKTTSTILGISHQNVFGDNRDFYKAQIQVLKALYYKKKYSFLIKLCLFH